MVSTRPVLRVLNRDATDEEVAAILAAVAMCTQAAVAPDSGAGGAAYDFPIQPRTR